MRDTPLNREQADMLQTLRSSSRVMLGLVEDVLDFSKIERRPRLRWRRLISTCMRSLTAPAAFCCPGCSQGRGVRGVLMPEVRPAVRGDPITCGRS